jgi:exodeoxyribonuclease V gamma subunit
LDNPFQREVIVTQTMGMEMWLKTNLAHKQGVVAHVQFMNPNGLLWELQKLLLTDNQQINAHTIRFKLFALLDSNDFKAKFPEVAKYYKDNHLKRIQLASKLTTLFDHYQVFRPEMVEGWESDALQNKDSAAEQWQQWLWKRLQLESQKSIVQKLVEAINQRPDEVKEHFPRISVFALTTGNTFHLQLLKKLSEITQVDMYLQLPSAEAEHKNPLLKSMGLKTKELRDLVEEHYQKPMPFEPHLNGQTTTLGKLQSQIVENKAREEAFTDDGSIYINSCYTPVREVECLYNFLLNLFEQDKELQPSDILITTTQLDKYVPYLRAVFRNAPVRLPMMISGATSNTEDSIVSALEHIMRFSTDDLTAERVMSLLEQQRIQQRMGIEDTVYVRDVLQKANIRFGIENNKEDDTVYVSWSYGLDKLLLGYAMYTDQEFGIDGDLTLYPYQDAEASASYDLLRLKAFVDKLQAIQEEKEKPRTLEQWKTFLLEVMDYLIFYDDFNKDDRASVNDIYRALNYIGKIEYDQEVPFEVFLEELDTNFFLDVREVKLNTGNMTVTKPYAVKGIPYKVVCILGLDNDVFPRQDRYMSFDLLGEEYKLGDRSLKETDKSLFLDLILAAQQKLYISYIGQSVKNNAVIPSSIVTDSLVNYLSIPELITKQPLHGYSRQYNKDNPKLFTYLYGESGVEKPTLKERTSPKEKSQHETSIKEFLAFIKDPVEWYFHHVLNIYYEGLKEELPEHEVFELDNLQTWIVKNDLMTLTEEEEKDYLLKYKKEGKLPLGISGEVELEKLKKEIEPIKSTYSRLVNGRQEKHVDIKITINNTILSGIMGGIFDREFIAYAVSTSKYSQKKYKALAYVQALLLAQKGYISRAVFIDKDGAEVPLPIEPSTVEDKLNTLLRFFDEAHSNLFIFTIKAFEKTRERVKIVHPETEAEARIRMVKENFWNEAYPYEKEGVFPDLYLRKIIEDPAYEEFGEHHVAQIIRFGNTLNL